MSLLFRFTLSALALATITGQVLRFTARSESGRQSVANMNLRIAAWWVLCGAMGLALFLGEAAVLALFALFSLLAMREFLALLAGEANRRNALFWSVVLFVPLQYWLVWNRWMGAFAIVIPVCAFLLIPVQRLAAGGTAHFLEHTAKTYWGLAVCTYCLSYAPALLALEIPGYQGRNGTLLFYFLLVIEAGDVLQYCWGKLLGRTPLAPEISPRKTWEGLLGGAASATAVGAALSGATPFSPWDAAAVCAAITLAGVAGGLTMSAIKRDSGTKDYGTLVAGHGGVLDRIDSLCFSAPVFFYLVRWRCGA
ncbi:MAG TPA: phosphatidate cytidylyltransferase [Bryobacteraceae bacterium]|jgi:phosphatidate cytidylyltransferase